MSIKQFKFVSPGVFINEIDNSFLPDIPDKVGPVVIGRTERGPAMTPYKVNSFAEFVNVFGNPIPGGSGQDVWRYGNYTAPTYAAYAAQAYLKNSAPVTVVRLLGTQNPDAAANTGRAGWITTNSYDGNFEGGAYGLFLCPSSSATAVHTGTLAAIWYCDSGFVGLSGTAGDNRGVVSGVGVAVKHSGPSYAFKAFVNDGTREIMHTEFNFSPSSNQFIRKVFNTNPTLTNNNIGPSNSATSSYWLGESYENWLGNTNAGHEVTSSTAPLWGVVLPLKNTAESVEQNDNRVELTTAQTDWIFSQDMAEGQNSTGSYNTDTSTQNLFKIHALNSGLWEGQRYKISVQDIRYSTTNINPYGSFSIVVRNAKDSDGAVQYIERFSECNLDPASPNFLARKIGDVYRVWDYEEGRYKEYGNYKNRSKYVRVEMDEQVDGGFTNERYLPWGFRGPTKYKQFWVGSGSLSGKLLPTTADGGSTATQSPVTGAQLIGQGVGGHTIGYMAGGSSSFIYPQILCRTSSLTAPSPSKAYWGATAQENGSTNFDYNWYDYVRALPAGVVGAQHSPSNAMHTALTRSFIFTLDDLSASVNYAGGPAQSASAKVVDMRWRQNARAGAFSYRGTGSYTELVKRGFNQFTLPLYGGSNGLDVHEMDPFRNSKMTATTVNETTSYEYNSIKRAIESIMDPEIVDCNIITMPGLTVPGLNQRLLRAAENRADSLAVIDLPGGYQPNTETVGTEQARMGTVDNVIADLETLQENTSYGCAYYPWIQIRDPQNNAMFWAPPSIAALGVMANTEKQAELWFAPAGFNRGGLSIGAAGVPITNARQKLTSKQRDQLYEANINPIASFPSEGLVVFGQKTLQIQTSALDRINVRRLMNYIKKEVSRMAATVLFDQNVPATWNRFLSKVNPFLRSVKARFGLQDFKVVLDSSTTTPELIDRNIMYAKIFLKPTRAIEFIAIDFNISNSGAAFAD